MKGEGEYRDYLEDMLEATDKVALFITGMTGAQFLSDERTQFAVVRALEILGEASKRVLLPSKPDIPKSPGGRSLGCATSLCTTTSE